MGLAACADPEALGRRTAALNTPDGEDTTEPFLYPAVVRVTGGESCTGTLISPSHVLTAAHCVDFANDQHVFFGPSDTTGIEVGVVRCELYGAYISQKSRAYPTSLLPEYRDIPVADLGGRCGIFRRSGPGVGSAGESVDLAVLQLERPIPYPAIEGDPSIAAEGIFEDPIPVVGDPSHFAPSFDGVAVGFGGASARQYKAGADPDALGHWNQDSDLTRWAGAPIFDSFAFGPGTPMRGVFWTHTPGDVSGPGGVDRMFDTATRALASHYWSGPVAGPIDLPAPSPCFNWIGPFVGACPFCPSCSASFPASWLGVPGILGFGGECGPLPLPPMLRVPDGMIDPAPAFGGDPAQLFGGVAGRWLSASEPDGWLPEFGPRYVALAPDGLQLERVLILRDDGLLADAIEPPPSPCNDPQGCPPSNCDDPQGCDPLPLPCNDPSGCFGAASVARAVEPAEAASPPIAVFSARRRVVWVIARDGTDGVRSIDLPTGANRRAEIAGGAVLGHVLAATYSPADDALLILDTIGARPHGAGRRRGRGLGPRRVRLLRMGAVGGALEVVVDWPRVAHTDRFAMATEPSGALWIAASGDRPPGHAVLRFAVGRETARVLGFRLGSGVLRSTVLRAGRRGASFVVVDAAGRDELVGYEPAQLHPARPGDTRRWF